MTPRRAICVIAFAVYLLQISDHLEWMAFATTCVAALAMEAAPANDSRPDPSPGPSLGAILHRRTLGFRASTAERELIVAVLAQHMADGRLDFREYEERVTAAWAAVVRADLAVLLADLPRIDHPPPELRMPYRMHERW